MGVAGCIANPEEKIVERIAKAPPSPKARVIGVVYLLYFLLAFLGGFLAKGLVVSGDAFGYSE